MTLAHAARKLLLACAAAATFVPDLALAAESTLRVGVTTSFVSSGAAARLTPAFERQTGIRVYLVVVGSGSALIYAKVEDAIARGNPIRHPSSRLQRQPEPLPPPPPPTPQPPPIASGEIRRGFLDGFNGVFDEVDRASSGQKVIFYLLALGGALSVLSYLIVLTIRPDPRIVAEQKAAAEQAVERDHRMAALRAEQSTPEYKARMAQIRARVERESEATLKVRMSMKDPDSFDMKSFSTGPNGSVCVTYRAKNSFGAILPGRALVMPTGQMLFQDSDGARFVQTWNTEC